MIFWVFFFFWIIFWRPCYGTTVAVQHLISDIRFFSPCKLYLGIRIVARESQYQILEHWTCHVILYLKNDDGELEVYNSPASKTTCFDVFIFHALRAKGWTLARAKEPSVVTEPTIVEDWFFWTTAFSLDEWILKRFVVQEWIL